MSPGQVLFKSSVNELKSLDNSWELLLLPQFITAIAIYAATTFLWVWILTHFTLSRSYPVTALTYVRVPLSGWFFFGETLDLKFGLGIVLICAGIVLTVRT